MTETQLAGQHAALVERVNEALDLIKRGEEKTVIMMHLRTALSPDAGSAMLERLHQMEVSSGVLRDIMDAAIQQLEHGGESSVIKRGDKIHGLFKTVMESNNGAATLNAMRHMDMALQGLRETTLHFLHEHEQRMGGAICTCTTCNDAKLAIANLGQR